MIRTFITVSLVMIMGTMAMAQLVVSQAILQRVFQIRVGNSFGTAFALDVADRQYLITARHLVGSPTGQVAYSIRHSDEWESMRGRVILPSTTADIAAIELPEALTPVSRSTLQ